MRTLPLVILGLLLALQATVASAVPSAQQTTASLSFYWSPSGMLIANHYFSKKLPKPRECIFRLRAAIGGEGQTTLDLTRRVVSFRAPKRAESIVIRGLPGVSKFSTGDPVLTIQAETKCGRKRIVSNAVARFVKCGRNVRKVTGYKFLEILQESAESQDIRSHPV